MKSGNSPPMHPGPYVKENILPQKITIKKAAELMGVGRSALSNFLNAKAALSPTMAARIEKAFSADRAKLLKMQQEFKAFQNREQEQRIAVRAYTPSFLNIKAKNIDAWAEKNIDARSLLPALIRRLVHSTGLEITYSDFPAYDHSQRQGWDGSIESKNASAWVPQGLSGWEFGCESNPTRKANNDYTHRTSAIPKQERQKTTFVFVTPRNWEGKQSWLLKKREERKWKDVRAYDANDLEQWIDQSVPAQAWMAQRIGVPSDGCQTLNDYWEFWAGTTEPPISPKIFNGAFDEHQKKIEEWLNSSSSETLVVAAGSKEEALAFISVAALNSDGLGELADQGVIVSNAEVTKRLGSISTQFIPISNTDDAEIELARTLRNRRAIVITEKRVIGGEAQISVDLPNYESFRAALEEMGYEHEDISRFSSYSGMSPTILRRLLGKLPALRKPSWASKAIIRDMIPLVLAGAWKSDNENDQEILAVLSNKKYNKLEQGVAALASLDDSPVWSEGQYRGVVSKLECFNAIADQITLEELNNFFFVSELVLSEDDPSLDLGKDKRWAANVYNKVRNHSPAIRKSLGETLIILAVYGNGLLSKRLGVNIAKQVDVLVRKLLQEKSGRVWLSQQGDLPLYAEAAPDIFLDIAEDELAKEKPAFSPLFQPVEPGMFSHCERTGMLWALELLAWAPERLPRVVTILAQLSKHPLEDNWTNKPINSLNDILLSWKPHTSATLKQRIKVLESLCQRFPKIGWQICFNQIRPGQQSTSGTYRPRWRSDASGANQSLTNKDVFDFRRKCLDIVLAWESPTKNMLSNLIECLSIVPPKERDAITKQLAQWLKSNPSDEDILELREHVRTRTLTYRARRRQKGDASGYADYADGRKFYNLLEPKDVVLKHQWLFAKSWVEYSPEELEGDDFDFEAREKQLSEQRVIALKEIIALAGNEEILRLCQMGEGGYVIGFHLGQEILDDEALQNFALQCLHTSINKEPNEVNRCLAGLLRQFDEDSSERMIGALMDHLEKCGSNQQTKLRLALAAPFAKQTWERLQTWGKDLDQMYWETIEPEWNHFEPHDLNFLIDKLIKANRPRTAFSVACLKPDSVETTHLIRLLNEIATNTAEQDKRQLPSGHDIERALESLNEREETNRLEIAQLEYLYIKLLTPTSKYGLPNLSKEISNSPLLFIQMLAICFRRDDGGTDPEEWILPTETEKQENIISRAYCVLEYVNIVPGTMKNGSIDIDILRSWIAEVRNLAKTHGRTAIADQKIGQLLSHCDAGNDGIWPREEVRQVFEEFASQEISRGMELGRYNSRGARFSNANGTEEIGLAKMYNEHASKLMNDMPFTSRMLRNLAKSYDRQAEWSSSDERVRRRLRMTW